MDTRIVNSNVVSISEAADAGGDEGSVSNPVQPLPTTTPGKIEARPAWLVPSILATSVLMVLLIIVAAFRSKKR